MPNPTVYQASDARANFYNLLKNASLGLNTYQIVHRDFSEPVMLMSKDEYDGWMETIDILTSQSEIQDLRLALKDKKRFSASEVKVALHLNEN